MEKEGLCMVFWFQCFVLSIFCFIGFYGWIVVQVGIGLFWFLFDFMYVGFVFFRSLLVFGGQGFCLEIVVFRDVKEVLRNIYF